MKINLWGNRDRESIEALRRAVNAHEWYHVIDLGHGVVTPGQYDMRPLLQHYGFPRSLKGKSVLDVGPAHGYFAFEFESRGAARVATAELPDWTEHDADDSLRSRHVAHKAEDETYHSGTFGFAINALGSKVERLYCNVYDIGPETTGVFDIVFCGSVLLHLTDPLRAMFGIRRATREYAIIATGIDTNNVPGPFAQFYGTPSGLAFWFPNMECLEKMALAAGFSRVERVSEFELKSVDGKFRTPHGVIRAYA
ncbi:MAG: methyltransferase domain-containing protein [Candidatus Aminicenantales bacterium]